MLCLWRTMPSRRRRPQPKPCPARSCTFCATHTLKRIRGRQHENEKARSFQKVHQREFLIVAEQELGNRKLSASRQLNAPGISSARAAWLPIRRAMGLRLRSASRPKKEKTGQQKATENVLKLSWQNPEAFKEQTTGHAVEYLISKMEKISTRTEYLEL